MEIGPSRARDHEIDVEFGHVNDVALISRRTIGSLSARESRARGQDAQTRAPRIESLSVRGPFGPGLMLTEKSGTKPTLGPTKIDGPVHHAKWHIAGRVDRITIIGYLDDWSLHAGESIKSLKLGPVG